MGGAELVHVDAMSRNPVDPADDMGPDPIDQQHQRLQDTINLIEEGEDDDDDADNIQMQVNDPLYSGLFKAAADHQGYQQAIEHRLRGDNNNNNNNSNSNNSSNDYRNSNNN